MKDVACTVLQVYQITQYVFYVVRIQFTNIMNDHHIFSVGYDHMDNTKEIDLKAVRLCFQVFLMEKADRPQPLMPVVSEPIVDSSKY